MNKNKENLIEAVVTQIIHDSTMSEPSGPLECLLSNIDNAHLIAYLPEQCNHADHGVYGQSDFINHDGEVIDSDNALRRVNIACDELEILRKQIAKPIAPHHAAKAKAPFDYEGGMTVSPNIGMTRIREQQESLNNMYLHLQTRLSEIEDLVQEIDDDRLAQKVTRELDAKHGIGTKMSAFVDANGSTWEVKEMENEGMLDENK